MKWLDKVLDNKVKKSDVLFFLVCLLIAAVCGLFHLLGV